MRDKAARTMDRTQRLDVEIGARIKARRQQLRITQNELAEHLGISFQQIQKYERGMNRVSASTLILIAECLRCHPADFLGVEDTGSAIDWTAFQSGEAATVVSAYTAIPPALRRAVLSLMRVAGQKDHLGSEERAE